jgi:hypothetical protein
MQSKFIGIVLLVVAAGVSVWLGTGLASRIANHQSVSGMALGFVLFVLPFLAVGLYFLLKSKGEIVQASKADKERAILNSVMTRGRVGLADLAIENNASRDEVRDYIYDLIGKDLFTGYVNWNKGELVSAEAAQIKEGTCPNCGGVLELAGKGLVRCPYCGTETYLSKTVPAPPPPAATGVPPAAAAPPAAGPAVAGTEGGLTGTTPARDAPASSAATPPGSTVA